MSAHPIPDITPLAGPSLDGGPRCPNCGTTASRNFCPECGQEMISVRLSLRDLAREFLDDHVGWSTKVPRTLGRLLFRPGALTRDFVEGRRVRYLSPLRLYLSLSVLFFLVVASPPHWSTRDASAKRTSHDVINFGNQSVSLDGGATPGDTESTAARAERMRKVDSLNAAIARKMPDTTQFKGRLKARILKRNVDMARMSAKERKDTFVGGIAARMPNVMFVLLPLFAFLLKLLYWRRRRFYAEHFVFALHTHAVAFALLTIGILSPWTLGASWLLLACVVYFVLALRHVYGGSIVRTLVKSTLLGAVYGTTIVIAATGVAAFIYLFG